MKKLIIGIILLGCMASGVWGQFNTGGAFDTAGKALGSYLLKSAARDSVNAGIAANTTLLPKASFGDSLFSRRGKEWLLPLPDACDTTASALDSTTVKLFSNIDGAKGQKKLFYVYGNASTAVDSTIWANTFYPKDVKPDSIYFYASTTDSSKTSYSVSIWDNSGTRIFSSGNVTFTNSNVFERKAYASPTFATIDEHAIVYRVRVTTAATAVQIGQVYFKRL